MIFLFNVKSKTKQLKLKQSLKEYHLLRAGNKLIKICNRFSYFRTFTHNIITEHPPYRPLSKYVSWEEEGSRQRKQQIITKKRGSAIKTFMPLTQTFLYTFSETQSFLLGFTWSSGNITTSKIKSTSKKEPTNVSEITIYLHKNVIFPLLCQCGLSIHT